METGEDENFGSDDPINHAVRESPQDCTAPVADQLQHRTGRLKEFIAEAGTFPLVPSVRLIELSGRGGAKEDASQ